MIRWFRHLLDTLQALVQALGELSARLQVDDAAALAERIAQLETRRAVWEGEMEGALVKAQSVFQAARASEERARHLQRKNRDADDDEADLSPEALAQYQQLQAVNAAGGQGGEVPAMREDLARDARATIRARKWGRT